MKFLLVKSSQFWEHVYRGKNAIKVINENSFGEIEINSMKNLLEFIYNNGGSVGATKEYTSLPRCYSDEYDFYIWLDIYSNSYLEPSPFTLDLSFLDEKVKTRHVRYTNGEDRMFFDIEKLKEEIDKNNIHIQWISRGKK